jgi:hypothetical protein
MTTLQDKTNTTGTVQSPGNQIQFSRGGIAKKKYRRKSQMAVNNENGASNKPDDENDTQTPIDWWEESKEMMMDWFRCNPLRLGISGESVKFVRAQIQLGDKNKNIRSKCWRHVVVEMHGVPGLDEELMRVDHIPLEASCKSLASVLGVKFPNVDMPTLEKLQDMDMEMLKRMVVDSSLQKAKLKQRIKVLTKDVETLKTKVTEAANSINNTNDTTAPVGSGIAAVKALQRPSSQPSGEDVNIQEQLPQRPLTDRSDAGALRPYNSSSSNNNEKISKNNVASAKEKLLPVVKEEEKAVKVNLSKMTMLQRTEHFEKLRKDKLEKKRVEKEEAEKEELQKKKDQLFTKRKQSNSRWSHVRSRLGTQALKADGNNKNKKKEGKPKSLLDDCRSLVGNTVENGAAKENVNKSTASKKKSNKINKENALKKKVVSKIRSRMTKRKESVKNKRPSLLDMCQGMLEGTTAASKHGLSANEVGTTTTSGTEKEKDSAETNEVVVKSSDKASTEEVVAPNDDKISKEIVTNTTNDISSTVEKKPTPTINLEELDTNKAPIAPQNNLTVSPSVPQVVNFFDEAGSNKHKGKFIVQSPSKFAFDSFYRKRDKGTIKPGVSLLMARHEDTAKEEPIAVFFDRSKFTEEEASQWWDQNNFRFKISGKKPSEA